MAAMATVETLPAERKSNPIKSFITGGFGGVCSVLIGHPLDTIKVRLQTMPQPVLGQLPLYASSMDCAVKTIRNEGVRGLYRGMSAPLVAVAPMYALDFALYAAGKRLQQNDKQEKLTYSQIFAAGTFSGLVSALILAPGERLKVVLQTQPSNKYKGLVDCAAKLYKEGGMRSIYKGSCATMLRDLPTGFYFLIYEYLQDRAKQRSATGKISTVSTIFAGGMAGMGFWLLAMPPDVLKSRLQSAPEGTYKHGLRSVYKELMTKEGPSALYRGVAPILIRAFPANAALFFGMELATDFFSIVTPNF